MTDAPDTTNPSVLAGRIEAAGRRREAADIAALRAISRRVPRPIFNAALAAIAEAVRDNSPEALERLPSPFRERVLKAWWQPRREADVVTLKQP